MSSRPPFYLVCARSASDAKAWAKSFGLEASDFSFVSKPADAMGYPEFIWVRLPDFFGRPDWREIDEAVRSNDLRMANRAVARP